MKRLKTFAAFAWKLVLGAAFCQFLPTSILVVGWTYRLMQRTALKQWWRASGGAQHEPNFRKYLASNPSAARFASYPTWFNAPKEIEVTNTGIRARLNRYLGGLKQNAVIGFLGLVNTWMLTLLPMFLWQFGWYAGWDNSFNKGYEQFSVGQQISLIGIAMFLLAMLYVPMAQARQAVTGEWRGFYDFKTIWRVVQQRRLLCLFLAAFFSLVAFPLRVLMMIPVGFPIGDQTRESMTDAQLLAFIKNYYLFVSVAGFLGYVAVRIVAARVYASGVAAAVRAGTVPIDGLRGFERRAVMQLGLAEVAPRVPPSLTTRVATGATRPFWRAAATVATLIVWFTFVAQLYVSQFFNYRPPAYGFMNQPIIQAPVFRYIPDALARAAKQKVESVSEDLTASRSDY
ncbi:MAG: hypothetical protein AAB353_00960 [Candidatus Hydrogenedentota bacterium]